MLLATLLLKKCFNQIPASNTDVIQDFWPVMDVLISARDP